MKTVKVIANNFSLPPDTLVDLNEKQARARRFITKPVGEQTPGEPGLYVTTRPNTFKVGEIVKFDCDLSKVAAKKVSLLADDDIGLAPSLEEVQDDPAQDAPATPSSPAVDPDDVPLAPIAPAGDVPAATDPSDAPPTQPDMTLAELSAATGKSQTKLKALLLEFKDEEGNGFVAKKGSDVIPGDLAVQVINDFKLADETPGGQ